MTALPVGTDHSHCFPVVGKFPAAIQAHNVCSGQGGCLITTGAAAHRYRKPTTAVPATKESIEQFAEHMCLLKPAAFSSTSYVGSYVLTIQEVRENLWNCQKYQCELSPIQQPGITSRHSR